MCACDASQAQQAGPQEALALILVMVQVADQPLLLEDIGAGRLEDLLVQRDADVIVEVEARARDNAPFRTALSHVWISDGSGELNQRLAAPGLPGCANKASRRCLTIIRDARLVAAEAVTAAGRRKTIQARRSSTGRNPHAGDSERS